MFFVLRNFFYVAQISSPKPYKKFINPDSEHYNRIKANEKKANQRKTNKSEGVESEAKNRPTFDTKNMTKLPPADGMGNRKECHTAEDHLKPSTLKRSPSNKFLETPSRNKICLKRLTGRNQRQRNNGRSINNALKDYLREQWLRANWKELSKEIDEEIVNGEVDEETVDGKVDEGKLDVLMEAVEEKLEELSSSELDNSESWTYDNSTSAKDTSESETNTRSY